ncbi:hypothetical protein BDY19DRAFT_230976 [Irpex rosettiformis]|uniref:Uncharacterized protein n=1 Tax=Irpex rosettiformis TaxID=378272 RepID=A0ACB8U0Y0_9APHY|nr:hypothetical protein BDY19DRAFT_230976 [Irpex rosettiformis]
MTSSLDFAANELAQALSEQAFGISGFIMKEKGDTGVEAIAEIELLEGTVAEISLTSRGYQLKDSTHVYESIELALQAASPRYAEAKHAELVAKLSSLASSREK